MFRFACNTLPATIAMMQLTGTMAERQIRLMTELGRAAWAVNPMAIAMGEPRWSGAPEAVEAKPRKMTKKPAAPRNPPRLKVVPEPKPAPTGRKRARRQPSTPPAMPGMSD